MAWIFLFIESDINFMKPIPALIITYNPLPDFERRLEQFYTEFDQIIIVDNGSSKAIQQMLYERASRQDRTFHLLLNPDNLGIATALNQGFRLAIQMGCEYVITFDQDSIPAQGMTEAILNIYNIRSNRDKIAIIASVVENPDAGIMARYLRPKYHFFFERKYCTGQTLENVSIVITSGSMHSLKIYEQVGPFRDDFFIDYVDTEYCLRVKRQGFNIIVACNAHILHKLGDQKKFELGPIEVRPTFHSSIRWYYISRNRIPVILEYGLHFPHWLLYELVINVFGLFRMLIFEDHKWEKILSVILGSLDGLAGRMGAISESRKKMLSNLEYKNIQ